MGIMIVAAQPCITFARMKKAQKSGKKVRPSRVCLSKTSAVISVTGTRESTYITFHVALSFELI